MKRERPSYYDGTQFLVYVDLPPRKWTTTELYEHVYGVELNNGAKPWPYFRNAETKEWWSLSNASRFPLDALVWMIDLSQLAYKSREDAQAYLQRVLPELAKRAKQFGATAEAESSVLEALEKMDRVSDILKVRDYQVSIIVAAPENRPFSVATWWQALEGVGLTLGDGNLFWLYNENANETNSEPNELFCVEPYSVPGYFHVGDFNGPVTFPDVALHFRARNVGDPLELLRRMNDIAKQLAKTLGASLLASNGQPFRLDIAENELIQTLAKLRSCKSSMV